jgi:hypothetical protein
MSRSQSDTYAKHGYSSLNEALKARAGISRSKGGRFKNLRIYQENGQWFLTKMHKSQFERLRTHKKKDRH